MNERITMILGERRRITTRVTYRGRQTGFSVQNPRYELRSGSKVVEEGIPLMEYNDMTCVISPPLPGGYVLEFQFEVGGEQWIRRVAVMVLE